MPLGCQSTDAAWGTHDRLLASCFFPVSLADEQRSAEGCCCRPLRQQQLAESLPARGSASWQSWGQAQG